MDDTLSQLVNQESSPRNEPDAQVFESCRVRPQCQWSCWRKWGWIHGYLVEHTTSPVSVCV